MNMITDMLENENIAGSINRTNESIIKRLRRELKERDVVLKKKDAALKEKDTALKEKEAAHRSEIQEKDALIRELQQQLAAKKSN